jgi:hypothetical protein
MRRLGPRNSLRSGAPSIKPNDRPVARLHPVVGPSGFANGLAWKLNLPLHGVVGWFSPTVRVAFIAGDDSAVIARLRRRNATAVRITAAAMACPSGPVELQVAHPMSRRGLMARPCSSPDRTVEGHLTHIYAKLGIRSHSELAPTLRSRPELATPDVHRHSRQATALASKAIRHRAAGPATEPARSCLRVWCGTQAVVPHLKRSSRRCGQQPM